MMRQPRFFYTVAILISGVATFSACFQRSAPGADQGRTDSVQQKRHANDVLTTSASPFEDLTEFASAHNEQGMDRAIAQIEQRSSVSLSALDTAAMAKFDSVVKAIRAARQTGNYSNVALGAIEGYRILVEGLNEETLIVPKAVSLLDYAGFRLTTLAALERPDWESIRETMDEARNHWIGIEGRVTSKGLRDAMTTTFNGIAQAVELKDAPMVAFGARADLDLVDLLEGYFEQAGATAGTNR